MNKPAITVESVLEQVIDQIKSTVKPVQPFDDMKEFLAEEEPREETRPLSNGEIKNTLTGYVEEPLSRKLDEFDRQLESNF